MLVLTRREGEKIIIGDKISITIVRMLGDKVRVGVDAPNDVLILRSELEVFNEGHRILKEEPVIPPDVSLPAA